MALPSIVAARAHRRPVTSASARRSRRSIAASGVARSPGATTEAMARREPSSARVRDQVSQQMPGRRRLDQPLSPIVRIGLHAHELPRLQHGQTLGDRLLAHVLGLRELGGGLGTLLGHPREDRDLREGEPRALGAGLGARTRPQPRDRPQEAHGYRFSARGHDLDRSRYTSYLFNLLVRSLRRPPESARRPLATRVASRDRSLLHAWAHEEARAHIDRGAIERGHLGVRELFADARQCVPGHPRRRVDRDRRHMSLFRKRQPARARTPPVPPRRARRHVDRVNGRQRRDGVERDAGDLGGRGIRRGVGPSGTYVGADSAASIACRSSRALDGQSVCPADPTVAPIACSPPAERPACTPRSRQRREPPTKANASPTRVQSACHSRYPGTGARSARTQEH